MQIVGMPIVASGTSAAGLMTLSSSKRKKKYHSGRGTYVVVVGSAFGPSSAPRISDSITIAKIVMQAMTLSFATAYGKNGFPAAFMTEYSLRYCSFSWRFTCPPLLLFRLQLGSLVVRGLQP